MPLSLSQEDNVVDNRPLPAKATGAEAVAAFRAGQASAKKSKSANAPASASKHSTDTSPSKDKHKRKSTAPTPPPHSPAPLPASPPPSAGTGRKRKVSAVEPAPEPAEDEDAEDDGASASPLAAALADFVPASLAPLPPAAASQPLWLFQFPAKFDVAAFSALQLSLPTAASGGAASRVITRFQLNGAHYRIIEAEPTDTADLINLFPAAAASHALEPGRPFARLLRITLDHTTPHTATAAATAAPHWPHSTAALRRKAAVPAAKGLVVTFRPIGWMDDAAGQAVGQRRGSGFRKVAYEAGAGSGEVSETGKQRRKEREGKENGMVQERDEVGEKKKKKKKDKDRQKDRK